MLLFTLDHKSFEVRERSLNAETEKCFTSKAYFLLRFTQPFGRLIIIHGFFFSNTTDNLGT